MFVFQIQTGVEKMCDVKICAYYAAMYADLHVGETQTNGRLCDDEVRPPVNTGAALFTLTDSQKNEDEKTQKMRKEVELKDTKNDSEDDDNRDIKGNRQSTSTMEDKGNNEVDVENGPSGEDKEEQMTGDRRLTE
jgi:hypothetical protein